MISNHYKRALALAGLLGSQWVAAQSIDYGTLAQMFAEPVTTSVTGTPQRSSDVPANMEIITAQDIRRSGARDIPGALRHVIGVDVMQWNNENTDFSIRGYDRAFSQTVVVLINGRQVYADYFSFTPWSSLPVELGEIRQIEIVKGPSCALFGHNAVGGVINIITYNPLYDAVSTASLTAGSQDLAQGSAVASLKLSDKAGVRISGGGRTDSSFSTAAPQSMVTATPHSHDTRSSADIDGLAQLSDTVQIRVEASHARASQFEVTPVYVNDYSIYTTNSLQAELLADTRLGLWQARSYFNQNEVLAQPGPFGTPYDFNNHLAVAQLQDLFKLGVHNTLRGAVEYRYDSVNTSPVSGGKVSYQNVSADGVWEWHAAPGLVLTNAVRFDHLWLARSGSAPAGYPFPHAYWDRSLDELTFNSGLVWKPGDLDTWRAMVARGVLLPNLLNFGAFVTNSPTFNGTGNPRMDPTLVTNYEVDWDRAVPSWHAQVRAAVFLQRSANIIGDGTASLTTPTSVYFYSSNVGNSHAGGAELGIKGEWLAAGRWGLGYRYEQVRDDFGIYAHLPINIDYQHTLPLHQINANAGWTRGSWEVDTFVRYQSATQGLRARFAAAGSDLVGIAAYATVDARVAYRVTPRLTLSLAGQNLVQSPQMQTGAAEIQRQVQGTVTMEF